MKSVREKVLQHFQLRGRAREPDDELADALYALLWSIDDKEVIVDGWSYFHVTRESEDSIDAVGLMTLLPSGSVPIELNVKANEDSLAWSVRFASIDQQWLALPDSKKWSSVHLYATGERQEPKWTWGRQYHGSQS